MVSTNYDHWYPNAEIRMVVHTGTISGFDFDKVFQNRNIRNTFQWNDYEP